MEVTPTADLDPDEFKNDSDMDESENDQDSVSSTCTQRSSVSVPIKVSDLVDKDSEGIRKSIMHIKRKRIIKAATIFFDHVFIINLLIFPDVTARSPDGSSDKNLKRKTSESNNDSDSNSESNCQPSIPSLAENSFDEEYNRRYNELHPSSGNDSESGMSQSSYSVTMRKTSTLLSYRRLRLTSMSPDFQVNDNKSMKFFKVYS